LVTFDIILVVAFDPELRRSIEFVLEAEGFTTEAYALLAEAAASPVARRAACTVVDEDAVLDRPFGEALRQFAGPVVFLTQRLRPRPVRPGVTVLVKPALGGVLVEAVRNAVAATRRFPLRVNP
jgi:hypothetical protein